MLENIREPLSEIILIDDEQAADVGLGNSVLERAATMVDAETMEDMEDAASTMEDPESLDAAMDAVDAGPGGPDEETIELIAELAWIATSHQDDDVCELMGIVRGWQDA